MFFTLSKLLAVLIAPLNLVAVLLLAGVVLGALRLMPRVSRLLVGGAAFIVLVFGIMPTGRNVLVLLERRLGPPATMPADIDGILVPGGSFNIDVAAARDIPALNAAAERITAAAALSRRYPEAVLAFTGSDNRIVRGAAYSESHQIDTVLRGVGFDTRSVFYEEESRNTHENIRESLFLLMPQPEEKWFLLTSAWHMPRAAAVMHSMGWPGEILYWPVDYRTDGRFKILPDRLDVLSNMDKSAIALHEVLGWVTYRLTGRINPRGEGLS